MDKITVDLDKLFHNKLKLEDYFLLSCLINNDKDLLIRYTTLCGSIPLNVFLNLRNSGFIILNNEVDITFESITVTQQTRVLFNIQENSQIDELFVELLSTYPNKVTRLTGGTRRLHNDLVKCKTLYKKTISNYANNIDIELHKKIIKCIKLYYQEHIKDNKQEFMQLLATFLYQKTWQQYLNDIDKKEIKPHNYDSI